MPGDATRTPYPSLEYDRLAIVQRFDWLMPVGWYYKTMTNPRMWHAAEPFVRKIAGLGEPPLPARSTMSVVITNMLTGIRKWRSSEAARRA